jgi:AraC family transcriptional regulator
MGSADTTGASEDSDLDRVVFESPIARVAAFRCPTGHPAFRDSGPIRNHVFVFPRRSVALRHDGGRAFVADTTVVTLYNRGQVYWRQPVDPAGDECEWFAVEDSVLLAAVRDFDPAAADHPDRPFLHPYAPSDARAYLAQRALFDHLQLGTAVDPLWVEETVVHLLSSVLAATYAFWGGRRRAGPASAVGRDEVERARTLLSEQLGEPLPLTHIADAVGLSAFHLCRVFRAATGSTLHAYRNQVRLRTALEHLADTDLTRLALDLGYSSHSHFTDAFKRAYGVTPSAARRQLTGRIH